MRIAPMVLAIAALLSPTAVPLAQAPQYGEIEVLVTAGTATLTGASVALDLNNNGVWDEHLAEPVQWTDGAGLAFFGNVVAIRDHGRGQPGDPLDWQPARIMMGNLRGAVGAPNVQVDVVLPPGSGQASLGLYDLRGRRIAETSGAEDLALSLPGGLTAGVYFLRLSADPAAPVSRRITSVGVRTRTITATRVSAADAVAAGWADDRSPGQQKLEDAPHHINLIVACDGYLTMVQPEVIAPGYNSFAVQMVPAAPAGFVYIPPGTFVMGSPDDEPGHHSLEGPQHQVTLTRGFYMSAYEVTEAWWHQVMGGAPTDSRLPQHAVSWDLAVQFCNALSIQEGLTPAYAIHGPDGDVTWDQSANGYRLPTEAEWEYACRAGSATALANGPLTHLWCVPLDANLDAIGWYCGNRTEQEGRAEVGLKQPNAWGLYDMHGNMWEWVWCHARSYTSSPQVDPVGVGFPGSHRAVRGGYWRLGALNCRSASRYNAFPTDVHVSLGFRPARTAF